MPLVVGLVATVLLGMDAPSDPKTPSPIVYRVKLLDMEGLDWRTALYTELQPVSRQGGATIWTAPAKVVPSLVKKAHRMIEAPTVTAVPGAVAHVSQSNIRKVLTDVTRVADGPVNRASHVSFDETISDEREGMSFSVQGRKIDQGTLVCLVVNDRQVTAVHPVTFTETANPKKATDERIVKATIQVPEMSQCEVAGEWLIPNDGVLLVSLGVHTVADSGGKAVVRERLAVVSASQPVSRTEPRAFYRPAPAPVPAPTKGYMNSPLSVTTLTYPQPVPSPMMPSRALPEGRNASGDPVPLPPLPECTPLTTLPGSSTPCATPQGNPIAVETMVEAATLASGRSCMSMTTPDGKVMALPICGQDFFKLVSLDNPRAIGAAQAATAAKAKALPDCCADGAECCEEKTPAPADSIKRFSIRLPFNGSIHLEIQAIAQPVPSTAGSN